MKKILKQICDLKFTFLLFLYPSLCNAGTFVDCSLNWISSGDGEAVGNPVECSAGTKEFVGRVFYQSAWVAGRILPSYGKIFATTGSDIIESETYQVLSAPKYCRLDWIPTQIGVIPSHSVKTDNSRSDKFIARAVAEQQFMCGQYDIKETGSFVQPVDMQPMLRRKFEILVSHYPSLEGSLSHFVFDLSELTKSNSKTELVGQHEIVLYNSVFSPVINYQIQHEKLVQEKFILTEDVNKWIGISKMNINFPMFYGSDDLDVSEIIVDEDEEEIIVKQNKLIKVEGTFEGMASNSSLPPPFRHVQVCSTVSIYEDVPVPFLARITYRAQQLRVEQINEVLNGLGRNYQPSSNIKRKWVIGETNGILVGRFALHTTIYFMDPHAERICSDVVN